MKRPFLTKFLWLFLLTGTAIASLLFLDARYTRLVVPGLTAVLENLVGRSAIPYPIVLVHGFGASGRIWSDDYQIVQYFNNLGLNYGGELKYDADSVQVRSDGPYPGYDFYAVTFANNLDSVSNQAMELARFVDHVRRETRRSRVILVAFSMGGLTARQYLVTHPDDHHVQKLVTIGTPHSGSPLALLYDIKQWSLVNAQALPSAAVSSDAIMAILNSGQWTSADVTALVDHLMKWLGGAFRGISGELVLSILQRIEAKAQQFFNNPTLTAAVPALADLRPPRNSPYASYRDGLFPGRTLLDELNNTEHPPIEYASVIGEIGLNDTTLEKIYQELLTAQGQRSGDAKALTYLYLISNAIIHLFDNQQDTIATVNLFNGGDGVVSAESQRLSAVPFFQRHPNWVTEIKIHEDVAHLEECWRHERIKEAIGLEYLQVSR